VTATDEQTELAPARAAAAGRAPATTLEAVLRGGRWGLVVVWLFALVYEFREDGVPLDAQTLLMWVALGLAASCVGRHPKWLLWVVIDIFPFAAVLFVYDRLRGLAHNVGMPTWWHPQIEVDRFLFFGKVPTVWLQEHLKMADVRWWDVVVCVVYLSYFFVPFVLAGVLWLRSRGQFYRWTLRFVGLSFFCYTLFVLIPAAPPWAAARCTAEQVADHPDDPPCLYYGAQYTPGGGILGRMETVQPGANQWIETTVYRGFDTLGIKYFAGIIEKGHETFNHVAAVPSLHVGATTLFCIFVWARMPRWGRPVLVAYPLLMTFTLVYTAEHYVADAIAGAAAAFLIHWVAGRVERRIEDRTERRRSTSSLPECLPTSSPRVTTPSSP